MARVSQADVHNLLGVVQQVQSFGDLDAFRAGILPALEELVPYDSAAVFTPGDPRWVIRPDEVVAVTHPVALERGAHEHPILRYYADHPLERGRAVKVSDFVSRAELHRLRVYDEFLRPIEAERQIGISIRASGPLVVGFAFNRRRRDFSERDRTLLDLMRPHLAQAYRNLEEHERLRQALAALEDDERAVVLVASDGSIAFASRSAPRLLSDYFDSDGARLPEALVRNDSHVAARDDKRLTVRRIPQTASGGLDALVLEERRAGGAAEALEPLGLTRRESEVLAEVAAGKTNAEIALALGVRPLTVVKHLEHVFAKLGVGTRTAAAAKVFATWGYRINAGALLAFAV
jgi:DNA-binding CsgD family transcriptional regulator